MSMWDVKTYEVCVRMSPRDGGERIRSQFYTDQLMAEAARDMAVASVIKNSDKPVTVIADALAHLRILSNGVFVEIIEHSANKPWGKP